LAELPMQTITFLKATPADIAILVENRIRFALELSGPQSKEAVGELRTQMTNYFSRALEDGSCISFFARCGNEIAGIGSLQVREQPGNFKNPSGRWGYIMNMYTLPAFRRKGISKTILAALTEEGRKQGITAFELHSTSQGEQVYRQGGFEIHPEPTYRKFIRPNPESTAEEHARP